MKKGISDQGFRRLSSVYKSSEGIVIEDCEIIWSLEEDTYGNVHVADLLLDIRGWQSEYGPMDYTHPVSLVWNQRNVDRCVYKTQQQCVNVQIRKKEQAFELVVKINNEEVYEGERDASHIFNEEPEQYNEGILYS